VGIENVSTKENIQIIPNPNNGIFNLKFAENISSLDISISNISGKVVYKSCSKNINDLQIDLSGKSAGIYFVRLIFDNKVQTEKLIIK
jgi:hypothetical protein